MPRAPSIASNLFDASFRRAALVECGCNMHERRYFVMALDANDKRAALPIAAYRKLYKIEDEIRDLDPEAKLAVRQERSKPVFDSLASWCRVRKKYEPPATPRGKALQYFTNHEVALARFLDDGWVPMDNGIVERLHIRAALTRKNFLFAASDAGASAPRSRTRSSAGAGSRAPIRSPTSPTRCRSSRAACACSTFRRCCRRGASQPVALSWRPREQSCLLVLLALAAHESERASFVRS